MLLKAASEVNLTTSSDCCTALMGISLSHRFGRCINVDDNRRFSFASQSQKWVQYALALALSGLGSTL